MLLETGAFLSGARWANEQGFTTVPMRKREGQTRKKRWRKKMRLKKSPRLSRPVTRKSYLGAVKSFPTSKSTPKQSGEVYVPWQSVRSNSFPDERYLSEVQKQLKRRQSRHSRHTEKKLDHTAWCVPLLHIVNVSPRHTLYEKGIIQHYNLTMYKKL